MSFTHFNTLDIAEMNKRYRAMFINSLSGFKAVSLVGTIDSNQKTNLAVFSSVIHIGSHPPLIGLIMRPDSVPRHTYKNILETNCFTINHIHSDIYKKAHQTSARYPETISEFDAVGLTPEFHNIIAAPYVQESYVKYGLEFVEKHELKINDTILVIGKIVEVFLPDQTVTADGYIDIEKANSITCSGLDSYHTTSRLSRLTYAKPDTFPQEII
jgi:flavin reductase (DIM6/NTAB) family NADH-FMN oxidoreductase RutF